MSGALMILPAREPGDIRLLRLPDDLEEHEAFRHVTGIIAQVEEENPKVGWEDLVTVLEDHGYEPVTFILGPEHG